MATKLPTFTTVSLFLTLCLMGVEQLVSGREVPLFVGDAAQAVYVRSRQGVEAIKKERSEMTPNLLLHNLLDVSKMVHLDDYKKEIAEAKKIHCRVRFHVEKVVGHHHVAPPSDQHSKIGIGNVNDDGSWLVHPQEISGDGYFELDDEEVLKEYNVSNPAWHKLHIMEDHGLIQPPGKLHLMKDHGLIQPPRKLTEQNAQLIVRFADDASGKVELILSFHLDELESTFTQN